MELRDGMFAVKLCELEHQYGLLRSRLELCQGADHEKIRHLLADLRDRLPRLMHGEEDPQEERAEAAALFAEYAIDFAAQGVRSALLAALAAMDQQMNCEEQQGKEHPV